MRKGLVIWKNSKKGLVLSKNFGLAFVKAKAGLEVGKKIFYFDEDMVNRGTNRYRYMATAAVLLIAIMMIGIFTWPGTVEAQAYEVITIDINPSVELYIAENDRVIKVKPLNDDGELLVNSIDVRFKGMYKNDMINLLFDKAEELEFIPVDNGENFDAVVSIAVLKDEASEEDIEKEEKELQTFLESRTEQYQFLMLKGTSNDYRAAKSQGLSLGKFMMTKFLEGTGEEMRDMLTGSALEAYDEVMEQVTSGEAIKSIIKDMKMEEINERKEEIKKGIEEGKLDAVEIKGKDPSDMPENSNKDHEKNQDKEKGNSNGNGNNNSNK